MPESKWALVQPWIPVQRAVLLMAGVRGPVVVVLVVRQESRAEGAGVAKAQAVPADLVWLALAV